MSNSRWIVALLVIFIAIPAVAQPTIEITSPTTESVEIPFTLTGTATPGSKLIVLVDGQVFSRIRADATGSFTVGIDAISKNEMIEVSVQVDDPNGEMATRIFQLTGVAETKVVEELSAEPEKPEALAEVPPEPPTTNAKEVNPDPVIKKKIPKRKYKRSTRISAEALAALIAIGGSSLIGFGTGVLLISATNDLDAIGFGVIGGLVLALILQPVLVALTGNWMDGNGEIWAAFAGEAIGLALTVVMIASIDTIFPNFGPGVDAWIITSLFLPTIGTIIGYELSTKETKETAIRLSPTLNVVPTRSGSDISIGLGGSF